MKRSIQILCALAATGCFTTAQASHTCPTEPGCATDWLNVPGDFANPVNNFTMYLLGGWFNVEAPNGPGSWMGIAGSETGGITSLNTTGNTIGFTATQFDHVGAGQGTSTLNATLNHVVLGSANFFNMPAILYADGLATGALVDTATSTQGHWTLNTHLYADWNNNILDLGLMPLSTNASYSYQAPGTCDIYDNCTAPHAAMATGSIMDYHSGLAYLVGQGIMDNGPFQGLRVTIGLQGQDPLAAPVPVPAAAWLLGSGLLGLAGFARKRSLS